MSTQQVSHDAVCNLVNFTFQGQKTAAGYVNGIKAQQDLAGYTILAEALVERDVSGKVHIHEAGKEMLGGGIGAATGAFAGLIFGPSAVLLMAIAGSVVGGVVGHFAGRIIPVHDLDALAANLPLDSSVFVVLTEDTDTERLVGAVKGYSTDVVAVTIGDVHYGNIGSARPADA